MKAAEEATNELQECLRNWKKENKRCYENMVITSQDDADILSSLESLLQKGAAFKHLETDRGFGCIPHVFWCQRLIKFFLDRGADINSKDENGDTVLHLAIRHACFYQKFNFCRSKIEGKNVCPENKPLDVIKYVLGQSADPNISNMTGETPIFTLAKRLSNPEEKTGVLEVLRMLINEGGDVTTCNSDGESILHIVCSSKDLVDAALGGAANLNAMRTSSWLYAQTPLMVAAKEGRLEDCQMLVKGGADVKVTDLQGYTALHHAVIKGKKECATFLLEKKTRSESDALIRTKSDSGRDCQDLMVHNWHCGDDEMIRASDIPKTKWMKLFEMRGAMTILHNYWNCKDLVLRQWEKVTNICQIFQVQPPSQEFVSNQKFLSDLDTSRRTNFIAREELCHGTALTTVTRLSSDEHSKFWNLISCVTIYEWDLLFNVLNNWIPRSEELERITDFASLEEMDFSKLYTLVLNFDRWLNFRGKLFNRPLKKEDLTPKRIFQLHSIARLVMACFNKLTHATKSNKVSSECTNLYVKLCQVLTSLHFVLPNYDNIPESSFNENERLLRSLMELDLRDMDSNSIIQLVLRTRDSYFFEPDLVDSLLGFEFVNVKTRNATGFEPVQTTNWRKSKFNLKLLVKMADKGAHVDARNVTWCERTLREEFQDRGEHYLAFQYDTLQCACARVLAESIVPYSNRVPKHMVDFINSHIMH